MSESSAYPESAEPKKGQLTISVAIPCLNTEQHIKEIITKARQYADEVIVVDDGSTDLTAKKAVEAGATVIRHDHNRGKGASMKTAARYAASEVIIFLDGDGQHDPSQIPRLIGPIESGIVDFVIGSRFLPNSNACSIPFHRKTANALASVVVSFVIFILEPTIHARYYRRQNELKRNKVQRGSSGYRILAGKSKWVTDCTSGFTATRRQAWDRLNLVSDGYEIETEIIFEHAKNLHRIAEVPIDCNWGVSSSRLSVVRDGMKTLKLLGKKLIERHHLQSPGKPEASN